MWIAKLGEQETSTSTPVTISARKFQLLADGSQFEFVKRVMRNRNTLCVLRYKAGAFPDTQRLLKVYKQKGIKFIDGNSWLSKYNGTYPTHSSAIFPEYNSSSIKFAIAIIQHTQLVVTNLIYYRNIPYVVELVAYKLMIVWGHLIFLRQRLRMHGSMESSLCKVKLWILLCIIFRAHQFISFHFLPLHLIMKLMSFKTYLATLLQLSLTGI